MKIYDTEKEAREAAEAFDAQCEIETDIVETDNGYKVGFTTVLSDSIGFQPLAQFKLLKPCPFCGADANFENQHEGVDWPKRTIIQCDSCTTPVAAEIEENDAVRAWNNRPIEDAQAAKIAQLEKAVGLLEELELPVYNGMRGNPELSGAIRKLLDEIKSGGE
jgi:Lar family restriction alleviation protein